MKISIFACIIATSLLSACSKQNATPGETSKVYINAIEATDVEKFTSSMTIDLKDKIHATIPNLKSNLAEAALKIKYCGGLKNLTPNYGVNEGATTVSGYTLIEYKSNCPSEKQYLKMVKQNDMWLIDEPGPSLKQ